MRRVSGSIGVLSLFLLPLLVACGDRAEAEPEVVIPAGPPARDSMSSSSLAGIAPEEIALALPWSAGRLNRGAQDGQAHRTLEDILLLSGDGFDRFIITLRDDAPLLPGYRIEYVDELPDCVSGPDGSPFDPAGSALLELQLTAATAERDDGSNAIPNRHFPAVSDHLLGLHTVCDSDGEIRWVFDLAGSTSYRLMELVNPTRLVVDVQQPTEATTPE
jgi:hypothetical protein